jgi:hypothetical protein
MTRFNITVHLPLDFKGGFFRQFHSHYIYSTTISNAPIDLYSVEWCND